MMKKIAIKIMKMSHIGQTITVWVVSLVWSKMETVCLTLKIPTIGASSHLVVT